MWVVAGRKRRVRVGEGRGRMWFQYSSCNNKGQNKVPTQNKTLQRGPTNRIFAHWEFLENWRLCDMKAVKRPLERLQRSRLPLSAGPLCSLSLVSLVNSAMRERCHWNSPECELHCFLKEGISFFAALFFSFLSSPPPPLPSSWLLLFLYLSLSPANLPSLSSITPLDLSVSVAPSNFVL